MFCSICLNPCQRYHSIPCGHHACLACTSDYTNHSQSYQCPICLQTYSLKIEPKKAQPPLPIISILLYCIECEQAFNFQQMKSGLHRAHTFDHLEKILPLIREKALQKLNKGLIIENSILLSAQEQVDGEYLIKIKTLSAEIKAYFSQQKQMLLQRQQKIIKEVTLLEERTFTFLQLRRQQFLDLYEQLHRINQILQEFLDDRLAFDNFDILGLLKTSKQSQFMNRIKQIEKQTVVIPRFIWPNTLPNNFDSNCFLKYPETVLSEYYSSEPQRLATPKRVNLSSKIFRKMNCL